MPKLQQVLNDEIRRLSRREVNMQLKTLKSQISGLRDLVKELNGRVKALEKCHTEAGARPAEPQVQPIPRSVRVTAERIRKWRKKMGLSQAHLGALLGVNAVSVNHWEMGKANPRPVQKQKIAALRDAGSRQIAQLLAAHNIVLKKKAPKKAAARKAAAGSKPAEDEAKA